jgi:hypothetical protein
MHMAKTEGVRGMMKGNWTNCVRIVPNSAMKFFTFEQLCRRAARGLRAGRLRGRARSAARGRACVLRRARAPAPRPGGGAAAAGRRPRRAHPLGRVPGSRRRPHPHPAPNLTLIPTPHHPAPLPTRLISDHQREHTGSGELTPGLRLAAGAGAGIVAMSATYPLDMVRGRLTVQEGRNVQYSGILHAARTIMREVRREGVAGDGGRAQQGRGCLVSCAGDGVGERGGPRSAAPAPCLGPPPTPQPTHPTPPSAGGRARVLPRLAAERDRRHPLRRA